MAVQDVRLRGALRAGSHQAQLTAEDGSVVLTEQRIGQGISATDAAELRPLRRGKVTSSVMVRVVGGPRQPMFERFTEQARQVVILGQEEARTLKHDSIGTEHILLGLVREEQGLAARVLESLDVAVDVEAGDS